MRTIIAVERKAPTNVVKVGDFSDPVGQDAFVAIWRFLCDEGEIRYNVDYILMDTDRPEIRVTARNWIITILQDR